MRIIVEFCGGPRDGERLVGRDEAGALSPAACFYRQTEGARIGARYWCPSAYAVAALRTLPLEEVENLEAAGYRFGGHLYEIVARTTKPDAIVARVRHLGAAE